jgi:hypothetical protein
MAGLFVAGSLMAGLPAAGSDAAPDRPLAELVRVVNGTADRFGALGPGDYTVIAVGNQAFGVHYGSANDSAPVTFFSVVVRSFGTATVRDADGGRLLKDNVTLPFVTLVAERLDALFEFRDLNGDSMFNFRPNLATRDPFDINASEFAVKGALLDGDWNVTSFEMAAAGDDGVEVALVLTREDIPYRLALDDRAPGDGKLNKVEFTLNLKVTRTRVNGATVPHFEATVEREGGKRTLATIERDGTATVSYVSTRAAFKVDHDIVGWDFAPARLDVESRLMLRAFVIFASAVDARVAPWLNPRLFDGERGGAATLETERNSTEVSPDRPLAEFRGADNVSLKDGFGRAGHIGWVPKAQVYLEPEGPAVDKRVQVQILGGVPFSGAHDKLAFRGFVMAAGFVYPVGWRIFHDPDLAAESVEVEGSSVLPGVLPALILLGEAVLVVGALAGVLALVARAASGSAKARAAAEARRLEALKARYQLPPAHQDSRRGGG